MRDVVEGEGIVNRYVTKARNPKEKAVCKERLEQQGVIHRLKSYSQVLAQVYEWTETHSPSPVQVIKINSKLNHWRARAWKLKPDRSDWSIEYVSSFQIQDDQFNPDRGLT